MLGALEQLGNPGEAPPLLRMPLADMYTGIHGVAAINAALVGRASSGRGQHIDLALYDCMVSMHDYAVQRYFLTGRDSVTKHWLRAGADGWRMDVMSDPSFPEPPARASWACKRLATRGP